MACGCESFVRVRELEESLAQNATRFFGGDGGPRLGEELCAAARFLLSLCVRASEAGVTPDQVRRGRLQASRLLHPLLLWPHDPPPVTVLSVLQPPEMPLNTGRENPCWTGWLL